MSIGRSLLLACVVGGFAVQATAQSVGENALRGAAQGALIGRLRETPARERLPALPAGCCSETRSALRRTRVAETSSEVRQGARSSAVSPATRAAERRPVRCWALCVGANTKAR